MHHNDPGLFMILLLTRIELAQRRTERGFLHQAREKKRRRLSLQVRRLLGWLGTRLVTAGRNLEHYRLPQALPTEGERVGKM